MRERHWDQVKELLSMSSFNHKTGTLRELLGKGIQDHLAHIEEIGEAASKEYTLETALEKMENEWTAMKFVILNWKSRGLKILQGSNLEDIQQLLDDHTLKAQTIRSNPNVKFMEERACRWEQLMLYI
jgi:dynein heavy chain